MTGKEGGHIDHASPAAIPPHANAVNPDALEVAPGTAHERLEGMDPGVGRVKTSFARLWRKRSIIAAT